MAFDLFKPETWFGQDNPPETQADPNKPEGAEGENLVVCPVHGDLVTQEVADAHVQAEEERKAKEAEEQAAEAQKQQEQEAQQPQGTAINPEQQAQQRLAQQAEEERQRESTLASQRQTLVENQQQSDIEKKLRDMWLQVATPNERYNATIEPALNIVTKEMVGNNPLELKLGGTTVRATSDDEMTDLLRYITDNRGYLPNGGTPLNSEGRMSVGQYKALVENEKALDTPERQAYQYWQMQQNRAALYSEDAVNLAEILEAENERRSAAGLDEITASQLKGIGAVYADRVMRHSGRLPSDDEIQKRIDESRLAYVSSMNERILVTGAQLNPENLSELMFGNGWATNREFDGAWYYRSPEGQKYTADEILNNRELMQQMGEAITPQMVADLKKEVSNNPEIVDYLLQSIDNTPLVKTLISKAYPDHSREGLTDEYLKVADDNRKVTGVASKKDLIIDSMLANIHTVGVINSDVVNAIRNADWDTFLANEKQTYIGQLKESPVYALATYLKDPSKPGRLKALMASIMTGSSSLPGTIKYTAEHLGNLTGLIDDIYNRAAYSQDWTTDKNYEAWLEERPLPKASEGQSFGSRMYSASLGVAEPLGDEYSPTRGEILPWTNPLYWLGPAELKAMTGVKVAQRATNEAVAEMAAMFARGEGMEAVVKFAAKKAPEIGVKPEVLVNDATKLIANEVKARIVPAEFKGEPVLIDLKPGTPFEPGKVVATPEGIKSVETPTWKRLEKGDPIPGDPADMYFDRDTGAFYVKKTEQAVPAEGIQIPKEGKSEGEKVGTKGATYDELQQMIDDKTDELMAQGKTFDEANRDSELQKLYDRRDAVGNSELNNLITDIKSKNNIPYIKDEDWDYLLNKFGIYPEKGTGTGIGMTSTSMPQLMSNRKGTVEEVANYLYRKWAKSAGLDPDGLMSNISGWSRKQQEETLKNFKQQAEGLYDSVSDSLINAKPQREVTRGTPKPAESGNIPPKENTASVPIGGKAEKGELYNAYNKSTNKYEKHSTEIFDQMSDAEKDKFLSAYFSKNNNDMNSIISKYQKDNAYTGSYQRAIFDLISEQSPEKTVIPEFESKYGKLDFTTFDKPLTKYSRIQHDPIYIGTYKGKPVWSNGFVMDFNNPPARLSKLKDWNVDTTKKLTDDIVKGVVGDRVFDNKLQFVFRTEGAGNESGMLVYRNTNGEYIGINSDFVDYFTSQYGPVKLMGTNDPLSAIKILSGNKEVGIVMPFRMNFEDDIPKVLEYSKQGIVAKPQKAGVKGTSIEPMKPVEGTGEATQPIKTKIQQSHDEVRAAWDELKNVGVVADPKLQAERELRLYTAIVNAAKAHIEAGVKTVEEFARAVGLKMNEAVRAAWDEAMGTAKVAGYEALPDKTKATLTDAYWNWTPEQVAAVNKLNKSGEHFKKVLNLVNSERKGELQAKAAAVEAAMKGKHGDEAIAAAREAERGLLADFGLDVKELNFTPEDKLLLQDMVQESQALKSMEKPNAMKALGELIDGGIVPRKFEQDYLRKVFGDALDSLIEARKGLKEDWYIKFLNAVGLLKTSWASFDLSYTLRQGGILSAGNPKKALTAMGEQMKSLFKETEYQRLIKDIEGDALFAQAKDDGLRITLGDQVMGKREEAYISDLGMKIPVMKNFNRAGLAYINKLRFDVYKSTVGSWERAGREVTPEIRKQLATMINETTGATKLGLSGKVAATANAMLFSPQYVVSRFTMFKALATDPLVRNEFLKSMAAWAGANAGLAALLATALGAKVDLDPRSSEGGKIRIDNVVIDPWAGEQQVMRLIGQLITGKTKDPVTGNLTKADSLTVIQRFARGKVSPLLDLALTFLSGRTYEGKSFDMTDIQGSEAKPLDIAYETLVPGAIQDMIDAFSKEGMTAGSLSSTAAILGLGVYTKDEVRTVQGAFYNELKALEEKEDEVNKLVLRGDDEAVQNYLAEHPELRLKRNSAGNYNAADATKLRSLRSGDLRDLEKQIAQIQASRTLSDGEKKSRIEALEKEQAGLMRDLLDKLRDKQGREMNW